MGELRAYTDEACAAKAPVEMHRHTPTYKRKQTYLQSAEGNPKLKTTREDGVLVANQHNHQKTPQQAHTHTHTEREKQTEYSFPKTQDHRGMTDTGMRGVCIYNASHRGTYSPHRAAKAGNTGNGRGSRIGSRAPPRAASITSLTVEAVALPIAFKS